ncbi:relaxase/mobilization nuclease domain-containing protein [Streptococcus sp. IsoGale021]|uniref:relaxase/mobilization nuclease domain-containing protein n=1 Tax=Streptococcus TaxID=1301 RepID=UPI00200107A6|nr:MULTISPECIES: relaxase/mobilization nuclease domain-containing protein [Streptococcus]MCY7209465.1 relaxase/mobilization nuclease domain-containing protein [Streptococcus anginosus]MCY7226110.1 relaxase/mobilization nuclease domain-containing protein [Streptococcus anginosus]MDQ8694238.1 relaxase/mobilization nuclease domain-containing protein [Streptococcus sp. IsoGale021]MDU5128820.1 relaxase/mobilization nuclease domain-containing protein [Streptococcus anginosus]MEE0846432.1 relaxase/mo
MVVIKVAQIKKLDRLKRALDYITQETKTLRMIDKSTSVGEFDIRLEEESVSLQLVSGHNIITPTNAFDEFVMTKYLAELQSENKELSDLHNEKRVLAHHLIQSFSPEDNLTPEQVHEIGRKTALEFTGGDYQFVVATHMDRGHLHNHIIFNTTNEVTLKKFRWQKRTRNNLKEISDKISDLYGAKIIQSNMKNSHKKYTAWQQANTFKVEIKNRLEFLLKHSTSLEDFKAKAKALDLNVDYSGKFVKYRLTVPLDGKLQERNTRDDILSKRRKYSLENILKRLDQNQVTFDLLEIKNRYQKEEQERSSDFEIKLEVEDWQVKQETSRGIYLEMEFGVNQTGTILIPARQVDKLENGSYEIYLKQKDFFYFINPDQSQDNRFMRGSTVIKQLSKDSGEMIMRKNPNISRMEMLVKEFNFLAANNVTNGDQFQALQARFDQQLKETQEELNNLDQRIGNVNRIISALIVYQERKPEGVTAEKILEQFKIDKTTNPKILNKELQEIQVEREALREHLDLVIKNYTDYKEIKERVEQRERNEEKNQHKTI